MRDHLLFLGKDLLKGVVDKYGQAGGRSRRRWIVGWGVVEIYNSRRIVHLITARFYR